MRRNQFHSTRCVEGRLMRHDPQPDDPYLETDIGKCPECDGEGCTDKYGNPVARLRPAEPRPMTGLWAHLSPGQQAAALAYDGPENFGPAEPLTAGMRERVVEVLRPFVGYAELHDLVLPNKPDDSLAFPNMTIGAFRAARALLADLQAPAGREEKL